MNDGNSHVSKVLLAGIALCWASVGVCAETKIPKVAENRSPSFLFILTDDQGWSQLSFAMDPAVTGAASAYLETPNMERLAKGGMRFTSGYSPAPICTPTRRSILCGTSAARSGNAFNSTWVPAEHPTIPKMLKKANTNYRCAHFGKWGEAMISTPEECGYDASDGMTGNATGGLPSTLGGKSHRDGPPHYIDNKDPKRTPSITASAIDFMREQVKAGHPFFVQVSTYATHLSVVCRDKTLAKYQAKGKPDRGYTQAYAAMMEELDDGVGKLLDELDRLGVAGNTYVVFLADNGRNETLPGGDSDRLPTNHPLTGAKQVLYEGGIRVPFLIRGPGITAGSECRVPVVGYDLLPTFYELAGGKGAMPVEVDGGSLIKLLGDPAAAKVKRPFDGLVFHRPHNQRDRMSALRRGALKFVLKWQDNGKIGGRELYDVGTNPIEEGRDVIGKHANVAKQLETDACLPEIGERGKGAETPAEEETGEEAVG